MRMTVDIVTRADTELSARIIIEVSAMIGRRRTNQAALARTIKKTPVWLSDRMTGRVKLTVDDLAVIADGLGVSIIDLLPSSARRSQMPTDGESGSNLVAVGAYAHPDHPIVATAVSLPQQIRAPHPSGRPRSAPTGR